MKKLITILLSSLLLSCSFVCNVIADTKSEGLYVTGNLDMIASGNIQDDQLDSGFAIELGKDNMFVFIYSDGETYTNVSDQVEITGNDKFTYDKSFVTKVGPSNTEVKCVKFTASGLGWNATVSYSGKSIENISVTYPGFFAVDANKDPETDFSTISNNYNLNVDDEKELKFYSYDGTLYDISNSISIGDDEAISYNSSTHILKAVKEGEYEVKLTDGPGVWFNVNGGGQGYDPSQSEAKFFFEEGGTKYVLGIANGSSDGDTLHIDDMFRVKVEETTADLANYGLYLGIGKIDDQYQITGVAEQEIYNKVSDVVVSFEENPESFMSDPSAISGQTSFSRNNVYQVAWKVDLSKATSGKVKVSFKYNGESKEIYWLVEVFEAKNYEIQLDTETITGEECLSSPTKLKDLLTSHSIDPNSVNDNDTITIKLKENATYDGVINVDTLSDDSFQYSQLCIVGTNNTVNGGMNIKSGYIDISGVNFVAVNDDSCNVSIEGASKKVGIYAHQDSMLEGNPLRSELIGMRNCSFTGYDYGVASTGFSNASSITESKFENCGIGYYLNSNGWNHGGDTFHNTFVNCDIGIEIVKVPAGQSAYQLAYSRNFFYNNSSSFIDYKVDCDEIFFFTKSYYGKTYDGTKTVAENMTTANQRSAKISYPTNGIIYTNPCVRYPENIEFGDMEDPTILKNPAVLGIDNSNGLFTGIVYSSSGNKLNGNFLQDATGTKVDIDLCADGTGVQLATITFDVSSN